MPPVSKKTLHQTTYYPQCVTSQFFIHHVIYMHMHLCIFLKTNFFIVWTKTRFCVELHFLA
jgi:hypothetical protein